MIKRFIVNLFAFVFLLCAFSNCAFADTGPTTYVGGGGHTVIPIKNGNIRMVSERVVLDPVFSSEEANNGLPTIWISMIKADCRFVFKNTSKNDQEVLMGFPDNPARMMDRPGNPNFPGYSSYESSIFEFKTYINNKEVPVLKKNAAQNKDLKFLDSYPAIFIWPVKFKGGEIIEIRNTYEYRPGYWWGQNNIDYTLKTGALWKGNIEKAEIILNIDPLYVQLKGLSPKTYKINDNSIEWHLTDFKPTEDVNVVYDTNLAHEIEVAKYILSDSYEANDEERQAALFTLGKALYGKRTSEAKKHFDDLLTKYPDGAFTGDIYDVMGNYEKALEEYNKLLAGTLDEERKDYYFHKILLLPQNGEEKIDAYKQMIDYYSGFDPNDEFGMKPSKETLGSRLFPWGFVAIEKYGSKKRFAMHNLIVLYQRLGRTEEAEALKRALPKP